MNHQKTVKYCTYLYTQNCIHTFLKRKTTLSMLLCMAIVRVGGRVAARRSGRWMPRIVLQWFVGKSSHIAKQYFRILIFYLKYRLTQANFLGLPQEHFRFCLFSKTILPLLQLIHPMNLLQPHLIKNYFCTKCN